LIPGHRRVEDDFAVGLALGAQAAAAEDAPVLERQDGFVLEADGRAHRTPAMGEARRKVSRPSSQVPSTRPVRRTPAKGVARPLVANFSGSTVHSAWGSKATRSAGAPGAMPADGSPKTWRGPRVSLSMTSVSGRPAWRWSTVRAAANAVSRPTTPKGASAKGCAFSSGGCGA